MAVAANDLVVGPVTLANGVSLISLDFFFEADELIQVYRTGTAAPLVQGVDYTLAGAGTDTGTVTLTVPANGSQQFAVFLVPTLERSSDLQLRGAFQSEPFNTELDRVWQALQMINTKINRAMLVSETSIPVGPMIAETALDRSGRVPVFDVTGENLEMGPDVSAITALEGRAEDAEAAATAAEASAAAALASENAAAGSASDANDSAIAAAASAVSADFLTYGLGIVGNAGILANIDALDIPAGGYRVTADTIGTFPTGVVAANTGFVEMLWQATGIGIMVLDHATTGRVYRRRQAAGVWGSWREDVIATQGAAAGDLAFFNGSSWERLAKGLDGQVVGYTGGAPAVRTASRTFIEQITTSSITNADFLTADPDRFRYYEFEFETVRPVTDGTTLGLRVSTDGGASFLSSGTDYDTIAACDLTARIGGALSRMYVSPVMGNVANEAFTGMGKLYHAGLSFRPTTWRCGGVFRNASGAQDEGRCLGQRTANEVNNAFRFFCNSGDFASGLIRQYGVV
jgi:hypothetical protein